MFDVSVHKTWHSSLSLWNSIVQSLSSLALLSCGIACGAPGAQLSLKLHIIIANYDMKSVTPSVFALWNHVLLRLTKSNDDSRKDPGSVNKQRRKHLHGKLCVLYISTHGPTVPDVPAHRTYLLICSTKLPTNLPAYIYTDCQGLRSRCSQMIHPNNITPAKLMTLFCACAN